MDCAAWSMSLDLDQSRSELSCMFCWLVRGPSRFISTAFVVIRPTAAHADRRRRPKWVPTAWGFSCATNRQVAGSIRDGVIEIFHWHNPSGRTMALGLTQPLTEMRTRSISWRGKGGRCLGLTTLYLYVPIIFQSRILNLLEPSGPVQACTGIALPSPCPGGCK